MENSWILPIFVHGKHLYWLHGSTTSSRGGTSFLLCSCGLHKLFHKLFWYHLGGKNAFSCNIWTFSVDFALSISPLNVQHHEFSISAQFSSLGIKGSTLSINQSNCYNDIIPGVARLSGGTAKSVLNSKVDEREWGCRSGHCGNPQVTFSHFIPSHWLSPLFIVYIFVHWFSVIALISLWSLIRLFRCFLSTLFFALWVVIRKYRWCCSLALCTAFGVPPPLFLGGFSLLHQS